MQVDIGICSPGTDVEDCEGTSSGRRRHLQSECAPIKYSGQKVAVSTTGEFDGEELVVYEPLPYTALPVFAEGAANLEVMKRGAIVQEIWINVQSLQSLRDMQGMADSATFMTGLFQTDETSTPPVAAAFGTRLRGIFTAQTSGEYVWFIASDEPAELWFRPKGQQQQKIATSAASGTWPASATVTATDGSLPTSAPIAITRGTTYILEAIALGTSSASMLAVGLQLPDGEVLQPMPISSYMHSRSAAPPAYGPVVTSDGSTVEFAATEARFVRLWIGRASDPATDTVGVVEIAAWGAESSSDILPNSNAIFACDAGYQLVGTPSLHCDATSRWAATCTGTQSADTDGDGSLDCAALSAFKASRTENDCRTEDGCVYTAVIDPNGAVSCEAISCATLHGHGGSVFTSNRNSYPSIADITCPDGFVVETNPPFATIRTVFQSATATADETARQLPKPIQPRMSCDSNGSWCSFSRRPDAMPALAAGGSSVQEGLDLSSCEDACCGLGAQCAGYIFNDGSFPSFSLEIGGTRRMVQARLVGGGSKGVLQVNIDGGGWDEVCRHDFHTTEANMMCAALGFSGSGVRYYPSLSERSTDDNFALDDLDCPYDASDISECASTQSPYTDNCVSTDTVVLECQGVQAVETECRHFSRADLDSQYPTALNQLLEFPFTLGAHSAIKLSGPDTQSCMGVPCQPLGDALYEAVLVTPLSYCGPASKELGVGHTLWSCTAAVVAHELCRAPGVQQAFAWSDVDGRCMCSPTCGSTAHVSMAVYRVAPVDADLSKQDAQHGNRIGTGVHISHGSIEITNAGRFPSFAIYTCDSGYSLNQGQAEKACDENGLWSTLDITPVCSESIAMCGPTDTTTGCGGMVRLDRYDTALECELSITGSAGQAVTLQLLELDTEPGYDFLTLYESQAKQEVIRRISGGRSSDYTLDFITSQTDTLHLVFSSDATVGGRGFAAQIGCTPLCASQGTLPCQNGGECSEELECVCPPGFSGLTCDINIDDCASNQCNQRTSSACIDGVNDFVCTCESGWTGKTCDTSMGQDVCRSIEISGSCAPSYNGRYSWQRRTISEDGIARPSYTHDPFEGQYVPSEGTCEWRGDRVCDEPHFCRPGTDDADCNTNYYYSRRRRRSSSYAAKPPIPPPLPVISWRDQGGTGEGGWFLDDDDDSSNGYFARLTSSSPEPPSRSTWNAWCSGEASSSGDAFSVLETRTQTTSWSPQDLLIRCMDDGATATGVGTDVCATAAIHEPEGRLVAEIPADDGSGKLCTSVIKAQADEVVLVRAEFSDALRLSETIASGAPPLQVSEFGEGAWLHCQGSWPVDGSEWEVTIENSGHPSAALQLETARAAGMLLCDGTQCGQVPVWNASTAQLNVVEEKAVCAAEHDLGHDHTLQSCFTETLEAPQCHSSAVFAFASGMCRCATDNCVSRTALGADSAWSVYKPASDELMLTVHVHSTTTMVIAVNTQVVAEVERATVASLTTISASTETFKTCYVERGVVLGADRTAVSSSRTLTVGAALLIGSLPDLQVRTTNARSSVMNCLDSVLGSDT